MPSKTQPTAKRGPKPRAWVRIWFMLTPELDAMLNNLVIVSGVSKSAIARDALAQYGETVGYLPEGTAQSIAPTLTSGPGVAPVRKDK